MTLRLRNTLTRRIEPFEPLEAGRVGMYTCGPTVYRYAHVGNLRTFILADVLRRTLLARGYEVRHVKNITDVGHLRDERFDRGADRMLVAAKLEDKTPGEIAEYYEAAFHHDEALVNILPADVFPRATAHIPQMIALVERLEDAGYAYAVEGNVYFAVGRFEGYGRLSGNSPDELRAGHRGEIEPDKRDPADFALWKRAGEGRILAWPTRRWGPGFPGWHIECSAMSMTHLGETFDIHTGGVDNVFPHHEDEIAQSAALSGVVPARYWVHGEHLLLRGRRMAKSAGNFQRITELVAEGIDPLAFRYLCLTAHYRSKLNLSDASLRAADRALASLRRRAALAAQQSTGTGPESPEDLSPAGRAHLDAWTAAVDDDLDLPVGLAVVRRLARDSALRPADRHWLLLEADRVLGLDLGRMPERARIGADASGLPAGAAELIRDREAARRAHDYARADALREELDQLGVEVSDGAGGRTTWRIRTPPPA